MCDWARFCEAFSFQGGLELLGTNWTRDDRGIPMIQLLTLPLTFLQDLQVVPLERPKHIAELQELGDVCDVTLMRAVSKLLLLRDRKGPAPHFKMAS